MGLALTVIMVCQDDHTGTREVGAHLASHGHAQRDIEALFLLIERVIDDDDATWLLTFVLVKAQNTRVVFRTSDVIRVRQDGAGDGACGAA